MSILHQDKRIIEDAWFGRVLNRRSFRLSLGSHVDEDLRILLRDLKNEPHSSPLFIYAKIDTRDLKAIRFLEEEKFNLVDTNVLFEKETVSHPSRKPSCLVRLATLADKNQTVELARRSFYASRFHLDPQIGLEQANHLKAEWTASYFLGKRGDQMILAEKDGRIAGFLLLMKMKDEAILIDLIAVDPGLRGKGIASSLIAFAEEMNQGHPCLRVGTQVANIASIRLYEKLGFRLTESQYVFHYHQPPSCPDENR